MAFLYYAKVNVNSNIHEVRPKKDGISAIMNRIYYELNDEVEYVVEETNNFVDDSGEEQSITKSDTYNFSELEKVNDGNDYYISGKIVLRFPFKGEEFDQETRESRLVVYNKNAVSTYFLFDLESELVVFFERTKLGYNQFIEGFQGLLDLHIPDIGFLIFLAKDQYAVGERIKMFHRFNKITSTIIPPNANEEALEELYDKKSEELSSGNITRQTSIFETHKRNKHGINIHTEEVSKTIDTGKAFITKGYGNLKIEGENKAGVEINYNSDADSPIQTKITGKQKNEKETFKQMALKGIIAILGQQTVDRIKHDNNKNKPPKD